MQWGATTFGAKMLLQRFRRDKQSVPDSLDRRHAVAMDSQWAQTSTRRIGMLPRVAFEYGHTICASSTSKSASARARPGRLILSSTSVSERYEFVHVLYRQVLYDRQAPGRRARLHRRIGERLEALYSQRLDEIVPVLVQHFDAAADWPRAIKYLRMAADVAVRRYAPLEAISMLQRALDLASRLPEAERPLSEIDTLEKLATSYHTSADSRRTETYQALVEKAAAQGLVDTEVRALVGLAWTEHITSTRRSLDVVTRALKLSARQHDPVLRARMRVRALACRVWASGWSAGDAEESRSALAQIRAAGDPAILAPYLIYYGVIPAYSSEYREACRNLVEGRAMLRATIGENPYVSFPYEVVQVLLPTCLMYLGEWDKALQEIDATIAMLDANGDYYRGQTARVHRAALHLHAMDFAGARDICESAVPLTRGSPGWESQRSRNGTAG